MTTPPIVVEVVWPDGDGEGDSLPTNGGTTPPPPSEDE